MAQVITISPDGEISGLQRKKGQGLDLRKLGHADIERASEIAWNEVVQCWHVEPMSPRVVAWMTGRPGRPKATLRLNQWRRALNTEQPPAGSHEVPIVPRSLHGDYWIGFEDYDDAVKAEVAFLDALRQIGVF